MNDLSATLRDEARGGDAPLLGAGISPSQQSLVCEKWIDAMLAKLSDARLLEMRTDVCFQDASALGSGAPATSPLARIGMDRSSLAAYGLAPETVDRVYRVLFVYSLGFQQVLREVSRRGRGQAGQAQQLMGQIWQVYSHLLELCDPGNHLMALTELVEKNRRWFEGETAILRHQLTAAEQAKEDMARRLQQREDRVQELLQLRQADAAVIAQLQQQLNEQESAARDAWDRGDLLRHRLAAANQAISEKAAAVRSLTQQLNDAVLANERFSSQVHQMDTELQV